MGFFVDASMRVASGDSRIRSSRRIAANAINHIRIRVWPAHKNEIKLVNVILTKNISTRDSILSMTGSASSSCPWDDSTDCEVGDVG